MPTVVAVAMAVLAVAASVAVAVVDRVVVAMVVAMVEAMVEAVVAVVEAVLLAALVRDVVLASLVRLRDAGASVVASEVAATSAPRAHGRRLLSDCGDTRLAGCALPAHGS